MKVHFFFIWIANGPNINRPFQYVDSGLPALESFLALFLDNLHPFLFSVLELLLFKC